jgi:cbb3-type cytochrome oxidase cytochrome c subunit
MKHIRNPRSVVPNSAMPPYAGISDDDLKSLAAYLVTLK